MKTKISLLQGATERHFHIVPGEIARITLSPEREAIFNHLARIDHSRFPEFVSDILRLVENHTDVKITDGPGDETQDVLSTTPDGKRRLTQCKHTIALKQHIGPNELDAAFVACHRKNCSEGVLVTNSDLTPQAKRYVTDREYARLGEQTGAAIVEVDYWNNTRIWERIATNSAILSKWFGGMGQTHGLRRFWFYMVVHRMPDGNSHALRFEDVKTGLADEGQVVDASTLQVTLNSEVNFVIAESFARDLDLGVNFIGPQTEHRLINVPLAAFKVHVTVADVVGPYEPANYRDLIVKFLGDRVLPELPDDGWWHLIATTPQAFVFLQDILEPKVISVSEAESFVRVGGAPVSVEKKWILPSGGDFHRLCDEDEDDLRWRHVPSGTTITLILNQRAHPIAAYEHYVRQAALMKRIEEYVFRALEHASPEDFERVRRVVKDPRWIMMSASNGSLFWAFPPSVEATEIDALDDLLIEQGIKVLRVADEDRSTIVQQIDLTGQEEVLIMNSSESDISVPVMLDERLIWLARETPCARPQKVETWFALLKLKAQYEVQHGFDFMDGRTTQKMSAAEIPPFLCDLLSIRGERMLDLAFVEGGLSINVRIREKSSNKTGAVIGKYLDEFDELTAKVLLYATEKAPSEKPREQS